MSRFNEEMIFKYLDDACSASEKQRIQKALSEDKVFRLRFQQLEAIHESLSAMPLERSPESLTNEVMDKVEALPHSRYYQSASVFSGSRFLIISGILTALVAVISLFNSGYLSLESLETAAEGYQLVEEWSLVKGYFNQRMLTNIMLVIFGVLSLVLLDRVVLNPFFKKKVSNSY